MRSGPNTRRPMRRGGGGGGRRGGSQRSQNFESNGPDVKVRGNAQQVVDKYQALAREAATAGNPVMAENYYQHAEHYQRVLSANGAGDNRQNNRQSDNEGARNNNGAGNNQQQSNGQSAGPEAATETPKNEASVEKTGDNKSENPDEEVVVVETASAAAEAEDSLAQPAEAQTEDATKAAS